VNGGVFLGSRHRDGVEDQLDVFEENLDSGYWDEVFEEKQYFKFQSDPINEPEDEKGRTIGEFDVLAVNYKDKVALYTEVKSSPTDMSYAKEQIERAEEFFEDTEWEVIGRTVLYSKSP
jgi:hypothetical protein